MNSFFAMLSRMKNISRWALMRNTQRESLSEHTLETAVIAHALANIRAARFGGSINPDRVAALALYHDASEILTGDMPTPAKYHSPTLREAYGKLEREAAHRLLSLLPDYLHPAYRSLLLPDSGELADADDVYSRRLVKAADKLSALIKCIEERKAGNQEFTSAEAATRNTLRDMGLPEVDVFIDEFLPAYGKTLDEMQD